MPEIPRPLSLILGRGRQDASRPIDSQTYPFSEGANTELKIRTWKLPKEIEEGLTPNERELKRYYETAVEAWAYVYSAQEGAIPGTNYFYPEDATQEEVETVAQLPGKSGLRSHYTIAVRNEEGQLTPITYEEAYRGIYEEQHIHRILSEAAIIAGKLREPYTQMDLTLRRNALRSGDYKSAERIRLTRSDEPKFELVLGFYDPNTDKFGIKYAAQAWATYVDRKTTLESQWFYDQVREYCKNVTGIEPPETIMRIGYLIIMSGQAARKDWVGNNLPSQPDWRQEIGSKFDIFIQKFDAKFRNDWFPAFWSTISPNRRVGLKKKEVEQLAKRVFLRRDIAHEQGHSLIPQGLEDRLGDHARFLKELYCELFALNAYGNMPLDPERPQELTHRERDFALAAQFAEGVVDYRTFNITGEREEYYVINSIIKNELEDRGNVWEENGRLDWDNSRLVYRDSTRLLEEVQELIINGSWQQVDHFLRTRFDPDAYRSLTYKRSGDALFNIKKSKKNGHTITTPNPTGVSA